MPNGMYGSQGDDFGKYVGEELGDNTVNRVNLEDTAARQWRPGRAGPGESAARS